MDPHRFSLRSDINWSAIGQLQPGSSIQQEQTFLQELDIDVQLRPEIISPEDAQIHARQMARSIWSKWREFGQIWSQSQNIIAHTWQKSPLPQRKMLLREAWGQDLPEIHRPDLDLLLRQVRIVEHGRVTIQPGGASQLFSQRLSFLLPHINYDDLANDSTNLLFLFQSRAMNSPVCFWRDDLRFQHIGQQTHLILGVFRPFFAQFFNQEEGYGELVSFLPLPEHPVMMRVLRQEACLVGDGFLVLEAQQKLMDLLLNIARLLVNTGKALVPDIPRELSPMGRLTRETALCTGNLAQLALRDSYIKSSTLPLSTMLAISEAFSRAADNHLKDLRQDPEFFRISILNTLDHHWGWCRDENSPHPKFADFSANPSSIRHTHVWDWTIRKLVADSMLDCEIWRVATEVLQTLKYSNESQNPAGENNPISPQALDSYLVAYCTIRKFITTCIRSFDCGEMVFGSPDVRRYMVRVEPARSSSLGDSGQRRFTPRAGAQDDKDRWMLLNLFRFLLDENSVGTLGLRNLTNALAAMTVDSRADSAAWDSTVPSSSARSAKCQSLLSTLVQKKISTLFSLTELYHQLEAFHPWIELCLQSTKSKYPIIFNERYGRGIIGLEVFRNRADHLPDTVLQAAMPHGGRFDYPIHHGPAQQRLHRMIASERNLDEFWHLIILQITIGPVSSYLRNLLAEQYIYRTPEPVGITQQEQPQQDQWSNPSTSSQLLDGFEQLSIDENQRQFQGPRRDPDTPRFKVKTRGLVGSPRTQQGPDPHLEASGLATFEVDEDNLLVTRMLFHQPGQRQPLGDIKWVSVLRLMSDIGFRAEQLWGSAWKFMPVAGSQFEGRGSVILHAPHGRSTKLSFMYARLQGNMLTRRYGLDSSVFRQRQ